MTQLKMLSADDALAEIRRLYFNTSKPTIQKDLARALDLLKSMTSEDDRERATVFMEGLAEMARDWAKASGGGAKGGRGSGKRPASGGKGKAAASARVVRARRCEAGREEVRLALIRASARSARPCAARPRAAGLARCGPATR
jgi:hypothetical protein